LALISAASLAATTLACAPDGFEYDDAPGGSSSSSSSKPTDCDGEGCVPECPAGTSRNPAGACEVACVNWTTSVDLFVPSGIAVVNERVIASGTSSAEDGRATRGQLQLASTCNGEGIDGVVLQEGDASTASAIAVLPAALLTAGTVEANGVTEPAVLELDSASYAQKSVTTLPGLPAGSVPLALATAASGAWVVGKSDAEPWVARVVPGQAPCGAALPGVGSARAVGALADGAVVIVDRGGKTAMLRIDEAGCTPAACTCASALTIEAIAVAGTDATTPEKVSVVDRTAYVVGQAQPANSEPVAFALALNVDTGATLGAVTWDAGVGSERFGAVSVSTDLLFAGGSIVAPGKPPRAAMVAFPLPLELSAVPTWSQLLTSGGRVVDVAHDAQLGLFALTADETSAAFLQRCTADGC